MPKKMSAHGILNGRLKKLANAAFPDAWHKLRLLNQTLSTGNALAENYTVLYPILW
jgi:hypothetical protein